MKRRSFLLLLGLSFWGTLEGLHQRNALLALSGRQIKDIAQQVTVQVQGANGYGSGVLLYRRQNQYFVLTAQHVLADTRSGEEAYIRTHDRQTHIIQTDSIVPLSGIDAALVSFESDRNYALVTAGASKNLAETDTVYVTGFPQTGNAITQPTFTITKGVLSGLGSFERGYGLVYDSVTQVGMSGGPVLNEFGQLVGLHGLAEGERLQGVPVKAGFNLGIPVHEILVRLPFSVVVVQRPVQQSGETDEPTEQQFRQRLDRFYAALPQLIERRDAQRLYDFMPIEKKQFRYTTRTGAVQTFTARLVGATKYYQKSLARKEKWSISFDDIDITMMTPDLAQVSHTETVKWSVWPFAKGVTRRKELYQWKLVNGDWLIVSGSETEM